MFVSDAGLVGRLGLVGDLPAGLARHVIGYRENTQQSADFDPPERRIRMISRFDTHDQWKGTTIETS